MNHTVPGFLVEGFDHTYDPARHRAMNWDVCRMEGIDYAKGINDYFGWGKADNYGYIYGVVRDHTITMNHKYYAVKITTTIDANKWINPIDKCQPLNNVKVSLYNSAGVEVDTYTTDDEWNGAYVFKGVAPGTYTLRHTHADYGTWEETVNVTANKTSYLNVDMSRALVTRQGHYAYDLKSSLSNGVYTLSFKSTGAMDNAEIIFKNTSTGGTTSIKTGAIVKGNNSVTIKASDLGSADNFSWAVAFENLTSANYELIDSDNSIVYNNGTKNARIGLAIDKDPTSTNFGQIYTLTAMGQGLQRWNPDLTKNGSKLLTNMFGYDYDGYGSSNKYVRSNRLEVNNGKVYIANYAAQNPGIWVFNPTGTTATLLNNDKWQRAIAFSGSGSNRVMYSYHEKNISYHNIGASDNAVSTAGSYTLSTLINGDGDMLFTNKGIFVAQTRYTNNNTSDCPVFAFVATNGTVILNSSGLNSSLNSCQGGGMAISSDLSKFAIVSGSDSGNSSISVIIYSVSWSGNTPSFTYQYSIPLDGTYQVDQLEFDYADNLYVASRDKGILLYAIKNPTRTTTTTARETIKGAQAPAVRGHFAYDLAATQNGSEITFSFKSTGTMDNARIILTNASTGATHTIETGAVVAGNNTVEFDATELNTLDQFSWSVAFENLKSPSVEQIHADNSIVYNNGSANARIGLTIDNDETSTNFGQIYTMTAMGQGLQRWNPDLTKNGSKLLTNMFGFDGASSTSSNKYVRSNRMTVNNGKIYIANYAAENKGVWVYNPSGSTATQILKAYYERTVGFSDSGSNRVMYTSNENGIYYYNIGTADTWSAGTVDNTNPTGKITTNFANGDGDIIITNKGILVSQRRYRGSNVSNEPVFAFYSTAGTELFNSSTLSSILGGTERGGMVISSDLSTFAIDDGWEQDANYNGIAGDIEIDIFKVTWSGNTPSFTYQYSIPLTGTQCVDQLAFDHAENLYVASREKGLLVYAIKNPARTTTTKANSTIQGAIPPAVRGQYAYDLEMNSSEDYYTFNFKSTGDVDQAYIVLVPTLEGYDEQVINIGAVTKGENSYMLDRTQMEAYREGKYGYSYYNWAVRFDNPSSPSVEKTIIDNTIQYSNGSSYARGGVAVDLDPASDNYGTIYASTGYSKGIFVYSPDHTKTGSGLLSGTFNSSNRHSPFRLATSNGKLYIADWSDAHAGVWVYDPKAGETVTNLFNGTKGTGGQIVNNGEAVGGGVTSIAFVGKGEDRKMFVLCEDIPTGNAGNTVLRYDLGTADTWSTAPSANFGKVDTWLSLNPAGSTNVEIAPAENGIFVASSGNYKPAFVYSDVDGNILYNSNSSMASHAYNYGGAIAQHGNTLAVVDGNSDIKIYSIEWNTPEVATYAARSVTTTPTLSHKYTITTDYTSVNGQEITQMAFDPAGNLYLYSQKEGLVTYTLKDEASQDTFNADPAYILVPADIVGIEDVKANDTLDTPAEYYTLQGYKVDSDKLVPGNVYIKVENGKATKIVYTEK